MSIVAQSPPHRVEIAELFIRDAATLCVILLHVRSVHSHYDLATTNALPRRLCYLCSGQLQAWFKCSLKVGVALLDSRTYSERFHFHVIEERKATLILYLPCSLLILVGHSAHIVAVCLRISMNGPRTFWPSDSVLPGPPII